MTPEEKELLEKTYELSRENNKILQGIRRSNRWSSFMRVIYWVIIIGVSVWSYNIIQPYLGTVTDAYKTIQNDLNSVNTVTSKIQNVKR